MVISFVVAIYFQFVHTSLGLERWDASLELVAGVAVTSAGWLMVTFLTRPAEAETLRRFHELIQPLGPGWRGAGLETDADARSDSLSAAFLAWFLGCIVIYGALFGTGYALYGREGLAAVCLVAAAAAALGLMRIFPRVGLR
jgi:hypothetical protein